MIRRNTWILLVVLAALVGFSFYMKGQKAKEAAAATPTPGSTTLFSATEGQPTDLRIESSTGTSVEVSRDQSGQWVLKSPTAAAADQAAAEAAATQVGALDVLANVQLGLDLVGLDKPAYTLTVVFSTGKTHKLLIGAVTPIQDGYYVQLDGGQTQVVDKMGLDALLDLLSHPPYLATLTPVASPTSSPEPSTATPEVTLSPSGTPGPASTGAQVSSTPTSSAAPVTATGTP